MAKTIEDLYKEMCANCRHAKTCHDLCEHCDKYEKKVEETEGQEYEIH